MGVPGLPALYCSSVCIPHRTGSGLFPVTHLLSFFGKLFLPPLISHLWIQIRFSCGSIRGYSSSAIHILLLNSNGPFRPLHPLLSYLSCPSDSCCISSYTSSHLQSQSLCRSSLLPDQCMLKVNTLESRYKEVGAGGALLPPYLLTLNTAAKPKWRKMCKV